MQIAGENESLVAEFVLTGCTNAPKIKMEIVSVLLITYSIAVVGNGLIVFVIISDPRLHNPMYFFLCNLSIADICLITTGIPQAVVNCLMNRPVMSYPMCACQLVSSIFFGATECFLLVIMAYDRYIAISHPLHYMLIMNRTVCILLASVTWTSAFIIMIIPCLSVPHNFCGHNVVDHLLCEVKTVFKLLCNNVSLFQIGVYVVGVLILIVPFICIIFSYVLIVVAILKMRSEGNRMKVFSTCGSHLAVVIMYFGTTVFSYLLPQSKEVHLQDKIITAFYTVLAPLFNPLIYTLRNKEIMAALKRLKRKNV